MNKSFWLLGIVFITACTTEQQETKRPLYTPIPIHPVSNSMTDTLTHNENEDKAISTPPLAEQDTSPLEKTMIEMGLVDIQTLDPSIHIDVKYSTTDNFMKADAYGDLNKIFLQKSVAEGLAKAHNSLKKIYPDYRFIVFDGARPFSVQQKMWEIVKGTDMAHYVAPPNKKGSMHNYGCAVDLSVIDETGKELDMGTPFDYLGALAETTSEEAYIKQGKLTRKQVDNRLILRRAMESAGFFVLNREWWHFNAYSDTYVLANFKKIP